MKVYKSSCEKPIDSLPKGKVKLTVNGGDVEKIWVALDEANKKMYLLNNALALYPFLSWGSEWDLGNSVDVGKARGETVSDTVLTFHKDMYDTLAPAIVDDVLDMDKLEELKEKQKSESNA